MIIFGSITGTFNTLGTIIGEVAPFYRYSDNDSSLFGALFIVGGIVGSAIFGIAVEKTHAYRMSMRLISLFSCIGSLLLYYFMKTGNKVISCFLVLFCGASMVPSFAIAFDYAVESCCPIGESFSTGVLMSAGQLFGIIYTVICS